MSAPRPVRLGIVGAGLMGRELVGVCGRWDLLIDHPVRPEVVAVADPAPGARAWFEGVASVQTVTDDWRRVVEDDSLDAIYIAVPHHLHEEIYVAAAQVGRDYLAEKPFGIDAAAGERIVAAIDAGDSFVRVSSEFPFYPGALRVYDYARSGALGDVLDVRAGFWHSSDLNRSKPINWKRRVETCGEIGVMGDLGLHVAHIPLRLGWEPHRVFGRLDDVVTERPGPDGTLVTCDTWDNALLVCDTQASGGGRDFTMLWETRRIAPGHMNTWYVEAVGMDGGVRFTTRTPAHFTRFGVESGEQIWSDVQPGNLSAWPTVSGAIFEFGFGDALLQMWASYLAEQAGELGDRFGTATPQEALRAHRVFDAALRSQASGVPETP
jgi:predicted dehydrogenase